MPCVSVLVPALLLRFRDPETEVMRGEGEKKKKKTIWM